MASSAITNILPRMERLCGPYGMYGTVYGLSTRVVHIAHPVPARLILSGDGGAGGGPRGPSGKLAFADTGKSWRESLRNVLNPGVVSSSPSRGLSRSRSSLGMLASSSGASKAPAYNHFKDFSGDGVFTADGDDWKAKRNSLMHCLLKGCTSDKSKGIKRLEREANRAADSFIEQIEHAGTNKTGKGRSGKVNVVPMLQRATIGLIYRFITHHNVDIFKCDDEKGTSERDYDRKSQEGDLPYLTSWRSSESSTCSECPNDHEIPASRPPSALLSSYLESVTQIRMIILAQSRSLWFLTPRWFYRAFSAMYCQEDSTMGPIRDFARMTCQNAREGSPLAMLRARDSHAGAKGNPQEGHAGVKGNPQEGVGNDGEGVTKDLMDEAITLLFAGQDTSAATLSWTLHLLALYPDIQRKLAEEVHNVLNEEPEEERCTDESAHKSFFTKRLVTKMPLMDAVIKESMRLYPVAPFVVRRLPNDVTIPPENKAEGKGTREGKPTVIPEGTVACVWIYSLHRNPKFWHRPNDFVPERWMDPAVRALDEQKSRGLNTSAFMPFAYGPRNCLGQPLAHVILRILLARIMSKYEVVDNRVQKLQTIVCKDMSDPVAGLRKDMQAGFTVLPSGGVRLSVLKRAEGAQMGSPEKANGSKKIEKK
uniref:Cytochrome P450 n=1 Tax=Trieres chinensis TaxID=1514140 RepID=A0A7S1ZMQ3_TRICV